MNHAIVDTHRLISDLKQEYGFSDQQAEGVVEAIRRIDLEYVATRNDLVQLELQIGNRIDQSKVELLKWLIPLLIGQIAIFAFVVEWLQ